MSSDQLEEEAIDGLVTAREGCRYPIAKQTSAARATAVCLVKFSSEKKKLKDLK